MLRSSIFQQAVAGLVIYLLVNQGHAATVTLRIMQTADIHMHLTDHDYYADRLNVNYGLARTATLIRQARAEVSNSVLVDNGDLIQGSPLGDYMVYGRPLRFGEVHPAFKMMNQLDYDVGNIGNHEFNYGLDYLVRTLHGANFPYISANVMVNDNDDDPSNDHPYFQPWLVKNKTVIDEGGNEHTLKIGYIGFVPPQIMTWDRDKLTGHVTAHDMVDSARRYLPEIKAAGADVIIAVAHSGLQTSTREGMEENATYYLAGVDGIDAILFGHAHRVFPGDGYGELPDVDNEAGLVQGVPAVMPGFWGSHLGIVDLELTKQGSDWEVTGQNVEVRPIARREGRQTIALVDADEPSLASVQAEHQGTLTYMAREVGQTTAGINSYFAQVLDDPSIQIVNNAQLWYGERIIRGTEFDGMPLLAAAAPFKAGGRGGTEYYTDVAAGVLTLKNVSDLYIYPNDLKVMQLSGADVVAWLERSSGQFNQIDPSNTEPQELINTDFPSFNFDVIDGITYDIDVTVPARYNGDGDVVSDSRRIINVIYDGKPIDPGQQFLVVTNNYRAGGDGGFSMLGSSKVVIHAPDKNRDVIAAYFLASGEINPTADNNWQFAPWGNARALFKSSPEAARIAPDNVKPGAVLEDGFMQYELSQ